MSVTENKLLEFLERYIDDPQTCNKAKKDIVIQEDVDLFIPDAILDHI